MRFSSPLETGRLVRRYKRFLADIVTDTGEELCIHCPNTGSMLNCMGEGARVWFQRSQDPRRKLPGTWELVETPQGRLACVNTARANALVEEALLGGVIGELAGFSGLRREVAYGVEGSRVDFRLDYADGPAREIDPLYADALRVAQDAGVQVLAYAARLSPEELRLERPLPVLLDAGAVLA